MSLIIQSFMDRLGEAKDSDDLTKAMMRLTVAHGLTRFA